MKKLFANNISKEKRETILGWVMVSPFLIGFDFLTAIPMIASFVISFSEWDMLSNPEWIGFDNYKRGVSPQSHRME